MKLIIQIMILVLFLANCKSQPYKPEKGIVLLRDIEWKKCSEGQKDNDTCSGSGKRMDWKDAQKVCNDLNKGDGYYNRKGWRVPYLYELSTLTCSNCILNENKPSINEGLFPNTEVFGYWTSTELNFNKDYAMYLHFYNDGRYNSNKKMNFYVRCMKEL